MSVKRKLTKYLRGTCFKAPTVLQDMVNNYLRYNALLGELEKDEQSNQAEIAEVNEKLAYLSKKIDKATRDLF